LTLPANEFAAVANAGSVLNLHLHCEEKSACLASMEAQMLNVLGLLAFACFGFAIYADYRASKEMADHSQ
jgi:hypothetical protein